MPKSFHLVAAAAIGSFLAAPLAVGSYVFTTVGESGTITVGSMSIGAIDVTPDTFSLAVTTTTTSNQATYDARPNDGSTWVFSPVPLPVSAMRFSEQFLDFTLPLDVPVTGSFPGGVSGLDEPLVEVSHYVPSHSVVGQLDHYHFDGSGTFSYTLTQLSPGSVFRYRVNFTGLTGPDNAAYSFTSSGTLDLATAPGTAATLSQTAIISKSGYRVVSRWTAAGPISPIPEPAAVAGWMGAATLGLAFWRRRARRG